MLPILLVDNYDSFTYNLYDYLLQAGAECLVLRNDDPALPAALASDIEGVVLSPGPGRPETAGMLMETIHQGHNRLPMLGVCLGMQALGLYFGAPLVKASVPMHGKTSLIRHESHPLFAGIPPAFEVMRYHSLVLANLEGTPLVATAETEAGEIMALTHGLLPLWGVQFHPESILTQYGLDMIRNWVTMVGNRKLHGG